MKESNAITSEQIQEWKARYGSIYKTTVGETPIVWRKLKRKEYVRIMAACAELPPSDRVYQRQEEIVKAAAIWPENIDEIVADTAGIASTVCDEVMLKSGFDLFTTEAL